MAKKFVNLARMTTATVGPGDITLGTAVAGALSFAAAGVADSDTCSYGVRDGSAAEVGLGTYVAAGTILIRTTVIASTNGGAAISLSGTAEVFICPLGGDFQPINTLLTDILALATTDSNIIVGNGTTWVAESGATLRTSIGVGTGDSPQFTGIELGHATDTTITRAGAGDIAVEGNAVYRAGGTDVALADGGTGASTAAAARSNLGVAMPAMAVGVVAYNNSVTPNTKVDITHAKAFLADSNDAIFKVAGATYTCDLSVNGAVNRLDTGTIAASTWYFLYIISNGSTSGSLASLSATAPTLPSGYTYACRVGAAQTDGSSNLYRFRQIGKNNRYMIDGTQTTYPFNLTDTTSAWVAKTVVGNGFACPSTASNIQVAMLSGGAIQGVAPSAGYVAPNVAGLPKYSSNGVTASTMTDYSDIFLEASTIYIWKNNVSNSGVQCVGFTDTCVVW